MYLFFAFALLTGAISFIYQLSNRNEVQVTMPEGVMCTMDAQQCPDGGFVGRTGPDCEFVCPEAVPSSSVSSTVDMIELLTPQPQALITTPLLLEGSARGGWYFEASFPVTLKNWEGDIIAVGPALAMGDWMTEDFVPFTMSLDFVNPYSPGNPEFMKLGTLVLSKDNPSGLPEYDDSLEVAVRFAP